jgi:hypothetical protein
MFCLSWDITLIWWIKNILPTMFKTLSKPHDGDRCEKIVPLHFRMWIRSAAVHFC